MADWSAAAQHWIHTPPFYLYLYLYLPRHPQHKPLLFQCCTSYLHIDCLTVDYSAKEKECEYIFKNVSGVISFFVSLTTYRVLLTSYKPQGEDQHGESLSRWTTHWFASFKYREDSTTPVDCVQNGSETYISVHECVNSRHETLVIGHRTKLYDNERRHFWEVVWIKGHDSFSKFNDWRRPGKHRFFYTTPNSELKLNLKERVSPGLQSMRTRKPGCGDGLKTDQVDVETGGCEEEKQSAQTLKWAG